MEAFWLFILVPFFFATNSLDKAQSVQLFDEIFGEGWWDSDKAKEWHKLTLEHNFHHQSDRQNTQIGQIEPNSTDQNYPLTESDHSDKAKISEEISSNENIAEDERKRKIIDKFHAIKEGFKQKRKFSAKDKTQIEVEIAKHLKVTRTNIYKWKKEFGLNQRISEKIERKNLVEKFDQIKAELMRAGLKNSQNELDKTVAKELGISFTTIYNWKRELGQTTPNKHSHSEQKELMKLYYEIKGKTPKISDEKIAKMLKIGTATLFRWKSLFKRQQFQPNSVDGHSVEVNVSGSNVHEIGNSNSRSI